jgi:hypothetical protein
MFPNFSHLCKYMALLWCVKEFHIIVTQPRPPATVWSYCTDASRLYQIKILLSYYYFQLHKTNAATQFKEGGKNKSFSYFSF